MTTTTEYQAIMQAVIERGLQVLDTESCLYLARNEDDVYIAHNSKKENFSLGKPANDLERLTKALEVRPIEPLVFVPPRKLDLSLNSDYVPKLFIDHLNLVLLDRNAGLYETPLIDFLRLKKASRVNSVRHIALPNETDIHKESE